MAGPRTRAQRRADALALLNRRTIDAWVATAAGDAKVHLVPLSLAWHDGRVILATKRSSATARNLEISGECRLAVGSSRDVVMIDARLDSSSAVGEAPSEVAEAYAAQADWEPRDDPEGLAYLLLAPQRIQVWREANEIEGRTVMRDGRWLDP
jgi:hypothetical protein